MLYNAKDFKIDEIVKVNNKREHQGHYGKVIKITGNRYLDVEIGPHEIIVLIPGHGEVGKL